MLKLLVITAIVIYLMRFFWQLMYPRLPDHPKQIEIKACEYCGILKSEHQGVSQRGRFFCSAGHAHQFFH